MEGRLGELAACRALAVAWACSGSARGGAPARDGTRGGVSAIARLTLSLPLAFCGAYPDLQRIRSLRDRCCKVL
jgi:hypothetical protein